ncbi:hypothetical protein, variant [Sphaeroforma arctica JP610]|uniref:Uncharacterized protein n=1 Tax=Sphaeroforma arctica JP610 TaxID=667725 RepID=A0A0L0FKC7_9EUKA|nr:hypothetical protein, variant [Sphaeroforma arctica JP610]KNC76483.1 hypothetical protein, variant [Sphaeroforma arctica JP610]|eukprot:XP_014150385.1 hypothetical protein, variant [Sphaeroforma arctica JP610]
MEYTPEPESEDEHIYERDETGLLDYRLRATHPTHSWYYLRTPRTYLLVLIAILCAVVGMSAYKLTTYHHKVLALEHEIETLEQQLQSHPGDITKLVTDTDAVKGSNSTQDALLVDESDGEGTEEPQTAVDDEEEDEDNEDDTDVDGEGDEDGEDVDGAGDKDEKDEQNSDEPATPPPAVIAMAVINDEHILHTTRDEFVSYTIDTSRNREFFDTDLTDQRISYLAKAISPAFVRVGGTGNDWLTYQLGDESDCKQKGEVTSHGFQGECMNATWFDNLMGFAERAEAKLIFGLNVLYPWWPYGNEGRDEKPIEYSTWNSSNSAELLRYAVQKKYPLWGLELGNEENVRMTGKDTAKHYNTLSTLLDEIYGSTDMSRPELLGPDPHSHFINAWHWNKDGAREWAADFLEGIGSELTAFTYHEYTGIVDEETTLSPDILNYGAQTGDRAAEAVSAYNEKANGRVEVWAGEIGNQNEGGTEWGATFGTSLWYADSLGLKATHGHSVYLR